MFNVGDAEKIASKFATSAGLVPGTPEHARMQNFEARVAGARRRPAIIEVADNIWWNFGFPLTVGLGIAAVMQLLNN